MNVGGVGGRALPCGKQKGPLSVNLGKGKSWDEEAWEGTLLSPLCWDRQTFSVMVQIIASLGFAKCQLSSVESGAMARNK